MDERDEHLGPDDFELGDDVIDVDRLPGGAGLVLRIRFDHAEAEAVLARADFEDLTAIEYAKRCVMEHASQYTWTKILPTPWRTSA